MIRDISYLQLGATLYIPAIHKDIKEVILKEKYPNLKSVVICLEDSVANKDIETALESLKDILKNIDIKRKLKVFVRPRDIKMLKKIIEFSNIYKIDGFSLAKFDTTNAIQYLNVFRKHNDFYFMPILETKDVFHQDKLLELANYLEPFKDRVLTIRLGSEDILNLLNMRRSSANIIYDILPFHMVVSKSMQIFIPLGFNLSGPVFNNFSNHEILHNEINKEKEYGIFNKTIIHPSHIKEIQDKYKPFSKDVTIARRLLEEEEAVFSVDGNMYEFKTHKNWAKRIIDLKEEYGEI